MAEVVLVEYTNENYERTENSNDTWYNENPDLHL